MCTAEEKFNRVAEGNRLAIGARFMVMGAPNRDDERGQVFIAERRPRNLITPGQTWTNFGGQIPMNTIERFGSSVSVHEARILVGAPARSSSAGGAYILDYDEETGQWQNFELLTPSVPVDDVHFGGSVAINGDIAIIGASATTMTSNHAGSVYIFARHNDEWSEVQVIDAPQNSTSLFGAELAYDGTYLLIGAPMDQCDTTAEQCGAVYVYRRNEMNEFVYQSRLVADDGAGGDAFGASLDLDKSRIVVGAKHHQGGGAAYVFEADLAGTFTQQLKLQPDSLVDTAMFGHRVQVHGDSMAVSAPNQSYDRTPNAGAIYAYELPTSLCFTDGRCHCVEGAAGDDCTQ